MTDSKAPAAPVLPKTSPSDMLDENAVSNALSVAVATLRNWRWLGEGPRFVKLGKRTVRYRRADVDAFIEAGSSDEARA